MGEMYMFHASTVQQIHSNSFLHFSLFLSLQKLFPIVIPSAPSSYRHLLTPIFLMHNRLKQLTKPNSANTAGHSDTPISTLSDAMPSRTLSAKFPPLVNPSLLQVPPQEVEAQVQVALYPDPIPPN
jgi:hypothetical protein